MKEIVSRNQRKLVKVGDRDNWICHLCGEAVDKRLMSLNLPLSPTVDHIQPASLEGTRNYNNLKLAHFECNRSRGAEIIDHSLCIHCGEMNCFCEFFKEIEYDSQGS